MNAADFRAHLEQQTVHPGYVFYAGQIFALNRYRPPENPDTPIHLVGRTVSPTR